jgi:hypothetical protein
VVLFVGPAKVMPSPSGVHGVKYVDYRKKIPTLDTKPALIAILQNIIFPKHDLFLWPKVSLKRSFTGSNIINMNSMSLYLKNG